MAQSLLNSLNECDLTFLAQGNRLACLGCRSGKLEELDAEEIDLECNLVG